MEPDKRLKLGPARMTLTPPPPWDHAGRQRPGRAGACLELLAGAGVDWEAVAWPGGGPASPGGEAFAALPAAALEPLLAALTAPWPGPEDQTRLEALERALAFATDFPGVSCAACAEQRAAGEAAPDCAACPRPPGDWFVDQVLFLHGLLEHLPPAAAGLTTAFLESTDPAQARLLAAGLALTGRFLARRRAVAAGR